MTERDRCGCEESAALRRELEAGTPAMYRARLREAERARDELAGEVERLTRERARMAVCCGEAADYMAADDVRVAQAERERDEARAALAKISEIRDSIVGTQRVNWSEHVYPLVTTLDAAGVRGLPYPEARERYGTLIERATTAERERDEIRAQLAALREAAARVRVAKDRTAREEVDAWAALDVALADTASAAAAHDARVRAEALREAADVCSARAARRREDIAESLENEAWVSADRLRFCALEAAEIGDWLRARADEIERKR